MDNTLKPVLYIEQMEGSLFFWKTSWLLSHATKECQVANFHGHASYAYGCLNGAKHFIFMDNTLKPVSYFQQM
jgi:hypothetical protein